MRRGLLAALRGSDGRSLARAIVLFILLNIFAGGVHAGATAAADFTVLCAVQSDGNGDPGNRHADHDPACCILGCTTMPVGVGTSAVALTEPALISLQVVLVRDNQDRARGKITHPSARGPPLDA